jgi:hypothetical protein
VLSSVALSEGAWSERLRREELSTTCADRYALRGPVKRRLTAGWAVTRDPRGSRSDLRGSQIVAAYSRWFTIVESFRDTKGARFGIGSRPRMPDEPIVALDSFSSAPLPRCPDPARRTR